MSRKLKVGGVLHSGLVTSSVLILCISLNCFLSLFWQKDEEGSVKSLPQHKTDSDVWVPDYLTPSWVSLPDDRPVLAIIQPGETAMEALEALCRVSVLKQCEI